MRSVKELWEELEKENPGRKEFYRVSGTISDVLSSLVVARVKRGWTLKDLAKKVHLSSRKIEKIEQGDVPLRLDVLAKMLYHLDLSIQVIEETPEHLE